MAARKKIGLVYGYTENWIAGAYYVVNVIKSFNFIDDNDKPEITILHFGNDGLNLIKDLNYPYVSFYQCKPFNSKFYERVINKISRTLSTRNLIFDREIAKKIDYVFPFQDGFDAVKNKVYWIPDFQEYYYPEFFSAKDVYQRNVNHQKISKSDNKIVFSSINAKNDYLKFFPNAINKLFVVNFASILDPYYKEIDINSLISKFSIKKKYFISPNQFWKHKNQITLLKAAKILSDKAIDVQIVFTGKENDKRNPYYFQDLKTYVDENNLGNSVKFLGFIDRADQLQLINNSIAVIQPSLFEGWSTVVEDCKSIGKYIILSDIDVHKEQLTQNVRFFEKDNPDDLANAIIEGLNNQFLFQKTDYQKNIKQFALDFINVFS